MKNYFKKEEINFLKLINKFKYPKLLIFVLMIFIAYIIFDNSLVYNFLGNLGKLSYLGIFFAGMLFSFGFTSPFAVGFFIDINPSNILVAAIIGGIGALISDILIFKLIRFTFEEEFKSLQKSNIIKSTSKLIDRSFNHKLKNYLLYVFAGILIASPLPDEAGVILIAGLTKIKTFIFSIISFLLNCIGILIILLIGS